VNVYTYTEARQKLASVLDETAKTGQVRIRRQDGQAFVIRPDRSEASPLDVRDLNLGITADEIVQFVKEGRRPGYSPELDWREYIAVDPQDSHGQPCIKGTQITVTEILDALASERVPQEILFRYPSLTPHAVRAAILYAAELARE
jgi:antitoxin Phd